MNKKILIVGGVAGGASVAARARRIDESAEIIIFERGPDVSFSNCALPFHLSGIVEKSQDLILMTPGKFKSQYNIEARTLNEVIKIKRAEKKVIVKDLTTNKTYEESYDKLILSPGANPILPKSIQGIDKPNVFVVRNVVDITKISNYIKDNDVKDIAVIGGGFIGVEIVENLRCTGKNVTLVEALPQIMNSFDENMAQILHKEMLDNGVEVILSDPLEQIEDDFITLKSGRQIKTQAIIMSIGVLPETTLARDADLEIGVTGGIKVNHNYITSDPDIYAVGDAIEVFHRILRKPTRLAMAGPAQRQARAVADHIYGMEHQNRGVIGSCVVQIFSYVAASTGLNSKTAEEEGIPHGYVYIIPSDKVGLMPDCNQLHFKLIYEYPTGRILGAQAIGKGNVDKRIDVIATMITLNGTLDDLKELEICYAPLFGTAKDAVNFGALVGLNLLNGVFKQIEVSKARELVENNAFIIDVREKYEFETGHLINAINIPLSEIRQRIDEIPKDEPVYLHCRSSQRSYNAIMMLQNKGFDNCINISGSFLGICFYEYFKDQITGREKIVTEYNFR